MKFSALNKEASNSGATLARKSSSSKPTKEAQVHTSLEPTYNICFARSLIQIRITC